MTKPSRTPRSEAVFYLAGFVFMAVIIELINYILHHRLCDYGIFPRRLNGLIGIITAPFLHYGWNHLMTNIMAITFLGGTVVVFYPKLFLKLSLLVMIIGGAGVWLIGRSSYHVGASGLLFGYFGFLISRGIYERTVPAIMVSVLVIIIYGGMMYGILPVSPYISWEAHLCGLLAGLLSARILK